MKKMITALVLTLGFYTSWAQEAKTSQYVFPDFEIGRVTFKTGGDLQASLNYNTIREEMLFMNKDTVLVMDETNKIDAVHIKGRKFIPIGALFYEEIPVKNTFLYVRYISTLNTPKVDTGLGTTSSAGNNSVANANWVVGSYSFVLPAYNIKRKEEFYLKSKNQYIHIKGINSLDQFFPNQLKEIKTFVNDQHIDFSKTEDVIKVVDHFSK